MNIYKNIRKTVVMLGLSLLIAAPAFALQPTSTSGLTGTWYNVNPNSRGTVKVVIWSSLGRIYMRTYGSCSPTPCDHGARLAKVYSRTISSNVAQGTTADWNFGFKTKRVDAVRDYSVHNGTYLRLNSFNKFASGDTRKDYFSTELFRR